MTIDATFIINGCERVIVSQIIRSPGVYFEKNKNQKQKNKFTRKISTDIQKLRSFTPFGQSFFSHFDLCFPTPTFIYSEYDGTEKLVAEWEKSNISHYSISYLRKIEKSSFLAFFQSFKLYRIVSKQTPSQLKNKLIQIFLKWLQLKINFSNEENQRAKYQNSFQLHQMNLLLQYFNFLFKLILKYEILKRESTQLTSLSNSLENFQQISFTKNIKFLRKKTSQTNLDRIQICLLYTSPSPRD